MLVSCELDFTGGSKRIELDRGTNQEDAKEEEKEEKIKRV